MCLKYKSNKIINKYVNALRKIYWKLKELTVNLSVSNGSSHRLYNVITRGNVYIEHNLANKC